MTSKVTKVFVPYGGNRVESIVSMRTMHYLTKLLQSGNFEVTTDPKEDFDIALVFSVRLALDYESLIQERKVPFILQAFAEAADYERVDDYVINMKKDAMHIYNDAATVLVFWPSQKLLLRHLGITAPIEVISPVPEKVDDSLEQRNVSFRRANAIPATRNIIAGYGVYEPDNGFEIFDGLARIMPDLEFYFFGTKTLQFNSSSHYQVINSIPNLHYDDLLSPILFPPMILSTTALLLPGSFHVESLLITDFMYNRKPVISNKNPILFDLLIDDKTANIATNIDTFYQNLHDINTANHIEEAYQYVSKYTYETEGKKLRSIINTLVEVL